MKKTLISAALLVMAALITGCGQDTTIEVNYTPQIIVGDQPVQNSVVTIDVATIDDPGWIAIHAVSDGKPEEIIGTQSINEGVNNDVIVDIDPARLTPELMAMLHTDDGQLGVFEFPGPDAAIQQDGSPVTDTFSILWLGDDEAEELATRWVQNNPTFEYDGRNLQMTQHTSTDNQHTFSYEFESTHSGYGDRSDKVVAPVITQHTIVVELTGAQVTQAIIDGRYNSLTQQMIREQTNVLKFQPIQCVETPWESWYAAGNANYIASPTDFDLVTAYYGEVWEAEILAFEKVESDAAVCQACEVCPRPYYFIATVSEYETPIFTDEGWKITAE